MNTSLDGTMSASCVGYTLHPTVSIQSVTTLEFRVPRTELAALQESCHRAYATTAHSITGWAQCTLPSCRVVVTGSELFWDVWHMKNLEVGRRRCYENVVYATLTARPKSPPTEYRDGWHLPYITPRECGYETHHRPEAMAYLSAMRCIAPRQYPADRGPLRFEEQVRDAQGFILSAETVEMVPMDTCHVMRPSRPGDVHGNLASLMWPALGWVSFHDLAAHACAGDATTFPDTLVKVSGYGAKDVSQYLKTVAAKVCS